MKNSLKIDYKALRQESLKPLFDSLERGFNKLDIDFYDAIALLKELLNGVTEDRPFTQKTEP